MKRDKLLTRLFEVRKKASKLHCNSSYGVTKKLLENDKPSKGLKLLAYDNLVDKEQRVA